MQAEGTAAIAVARLLDDPSATTPILLFATLGKMEAAHNSGQTAVVFTSRQKLAFKDVRIRLAFSQAVSALLMDVVRGLPADISFLISKGGITTMY